MNVKEIKGKKVLVIGLGQSGFSAAFLLNLLGARPMVTESSVGPEVEDRARKLKFLKIPVETGRHSRPFCDSVELAIISPGVPPDCGPVRWLSHRNIPIFSEIELGCSCVRAPVVAITGTNGKTTTVHLVHRMFQDAGVPARLLGNMGIPVSAEASKVIEDEILVLEVSSFQLERIRDFRPYVACLLNLTPDHLDRYDGMEEYARAKFRIFENQTREEWAVLNRRDEVLFRKYAPESNPKIIYINTRGPEDRGVYVRDGMIQSNIFGKPRNICPVEDVRIPGEHNLENVLSAAATGLICGLDGKDIARTIRRFKGVSHRLERCRELGGVTFINDSKATNVESCVKALEAIDSPVILIAGGRDKNGDFLRLKSLVTGKVKRLVLIGEAGPKIRSALRGCCPTEEAGNLDEALRAAFREARNGDTVLLSPACASFDMFRNYEERGEVFKRSVQELTEKASHAST